MDIETHDSKAEVKNYMEDKREQERAVIDELALLVRMYAEQSGAQPDWNAFD